METLKLSAKGFNGTVQWYLYFGSLITSDFSVLTFVFVHSGVEDKTFINK